VPIGRSSTRATVEVGEGVDSGMISKAVGSLLYVIGIISVEKVKVIEGLGLSTSGGMPSEEDKKQGNQKKGGQKIKGDTEPSSSRSSKTGS
jgi:hypothetical protein